MENNRELSMSDIIHYKINGLSNESKNMLIDVEAHEKLIYIIRPDDVTIQDLEDELSFIDDFKYENKIKQIQYVAAKPDNKFGDVFTKLIEAHK
jgi:hypothetical protein